MGKSNANISRNMYAEEKRYQMLIHQQGVPWVEADENDRNWIFYNLVRRLAQKVIGNGSPDDGFKIIGTGAANDFTITGGDGTSEGAGRLLVEGFQCILPNSRNYKGSDNLECTPISTGLAATILTDSAANFTLGGPDNNLAGRTLVPDITQPTKVYAITGNTQTAITVTGNMLTDGIQARAHYRIELSTPSAARTDEVYIDCYLDEIDSNEDTELKHTLGMQIETQRRLKLIQNIFVTEGGTTPAAYTDSDGNQHYTLKLATIQRHANQAAINAGDITDHRPVLGGDFWNLWQEVSAIKYEITAARGNKSSLDARLDISMDDDGELPEVVEARGSKSTLDDRLDVALNEDGSLKGHTTSHTQLSDMPDTSGLNPDHDARYVKKTGDTMTGNLGLASGKTVDGRDVSQDGVTLDGLQNEVNAARGTKASLDQRLDISLNEDGTLKGELISHSALSDMPDTSGVNADHDARYVKKAGDTMTGDLNMAAGKLVDGRDVSADGANLDSVQNEVITARGTKASLDQRLDVCLNENGTLKGEILSHGDLSDMPDTAGVNTDHDARYMLKTAGSLLPVATIIPYAGDTYYSYPTGWLPCDGRAVSRSQYQDLFNVIGVLYGAGNGSTTFNLPNLKNRFPMGAGYYGLSGTGGAETHALTEAEMPAHSHSLIVNRNIASPAEYTYDVAAPSGDMSMSTDATGGGQPHNNMPPYLVVNFLIKY